MHFRLNISVTNICFIFLIYSLQMVERIRSLSCRYILIHPTYNVNSGTLVSLRRSLHPHPRYWLPIWAWQRYNYDAEPSSLAYLAHHHPNPPRTRTRMNFPPKGLVQELVQEWVWAYPIHQSSHPSWAWQSHPTNSVKEVKAVCQR